MSDEFCLPTPRKFFPKKKSLRGSLNKALRFATLLCAEPHNITNDTFFEPADAVFEPADAAVGRPQIRTLFRTKKTYPPQTKRLTTAQGLPNALENTRITHQYGWKPYFFNRNACVPGRTAGGSLHWRCKNTSLGYTFHPKTRFRRGLEEKPFLINRNIQFPF